MGNPRCDRHPDAERRGGKSRARDDGPVREWDGSIGSGGSSEDWYCSGCATITAGDPGPACPQCGSREISPVVHGMRTFDPEADAARDAARMLDREEWARLRRAARARAKGAA